jgi:hypothetical protein
MVNILIPSISISLISAFSEKATNQPVTWPISAFGLISRNDIALLINVFLIPLV